MTNGQTQHLPGRLLMTPINMGQLTPCANQKVLSFVYLARLQLGDIGESRWSKLPSAAMLRRGWFTAAACVLILLQFDRVACSSPSAGGAAQVGFPQECANFHERS